MITSARYLSRTFISRFALLLLAFVVLFEIFDMMATGDQVISRNDSILALFRYSALPPRSSPLSVTIRCSANAMRFSRNVST